MSLRIHFGASASEAPSTGSNSKGTAASAEPPAVLHIASWNVDVANKLLDNKWFLTGALERTLGAKVDVIAIQECRKPKDHEALLNALNPEYKGFGHFPSPSVLAKIGHYAVGGAIFVADHLLPWTRQVSHFPWDVEARVTAVQIANTAIISVYSPNAFPRKGTIKVWLDHETGNPKLGTTRRTLNRADARADFDAKLSEAVHGLHKSGVNVILVGDLNTVQSELDYNKEGREHFTGRNRGREGERLSAMAASLGIVDSFRFKHPVLKQLSYTCSNFVMCSRLDYIFAPPNLIEKAGIMDATIVAKWNGFKTERHAPTWAIIRLV